MTPPPDDLGDLPGLLGAVRDGVATPAEVARLDALVAADERARRYYLEYADLHASLRHYLEGPARAPAPPGPSPVARPRRGRFVKALVVAAVAASCGWLVFGFGSNQPGRWDADDSAAGAVAVLTRSVGARWAGGTAPAVGSPLPVGRLQLTAGIVQFEFYGGAVVILEGPADVDLLGPGQGFCRLGRLTSGRPAGGGDTRIGTPHFEVLDRGAEFGLRVDPVAGSEVHVLAGRVELTGPAPFRTRVVAAGEAFRAGPDGVGRAAPLRAGEFVGPRELERRAAAESGARYRAWRARSDALRADPRLAAYYPFEDQQAWDRTLRNRAGDDPALDGAVTGCQWADGRWPGKGALDFKRVGDRVRVHIPEAFDSFTLAAWVRVDGYDRWLSALVLADGWDRGSLHWQLSDKGELILSAGRQLRNHSPPVLGAGKLGRWTFLVSVCDQQARTVTHYVDGRPVGSGPTASAAPVWFGPAEIGNWGLPSRGDGNPIRSFNGRIDELAVFRAALGPEEVAELYEVGKPNS